ncbi:MAG: LytTR family DNA-binding domain-containing protein [Cyclobacteriaceae bacterium]
MALKCVIIDDEVIAQSILERYIKPIVELSLVGKCKNALEANSLLQKESIDLLFLDIEMPNISGISLLNTMTGDKPKVIITTAYREYALKAFELEVVDYMLKPISYERFVKGVNKVLKLHNLEELASQQEQLEEEAYIYLKADKKMVQILLTDILFIEGLSNYVKIHTISKVIISYQKISYLQDALPGQKFIRTHRSYIVAVDKITSYTGSHLEVGGKEIPLGGTYKDSVLSVLTRYER